MRDWPVPGGVARRGAILLVHGLGEHSGRYEHVGARLAALGLEARGYDLAGHGRSAGPRGGLAHPEALLDELRAAFAALADARARARRRRSCSATAWAARSRPARRPAAGSRRAA